MLSCMASGLVLLEGMILVVVDYGLPGNIAAAAELGGFIEIVLVGSAWFARWLPISGKLLSVSGRMWCAKGGSGRRDASCL